MNSIQSDPTPFRRLWILGFAGHRSLGDREAVRKSIRKAVTDFCQQVDGEVIGRSSAAAGADLLFLEACHEAGLSYTVVLPFPEDRFREDFESEEEWLRAKALIDASAQAEIAPGNEGAPEAYHLASREILDLADAMIFVWNGMPARGIGGTGETVMDARERLLPHQIIDATSGELGSFQTPKAFPWKDLSFSHLPKVSDLDAMLGMLDYRARQGAPKSRMLSAGSITLNQIATVVSASLIVTGHLVNEAPSIRFLFVLVAAILPWLGARTRIHKEWTRDRLHAELLRSSLASHPFAPTLRPFAAELFLSDSAFLRSVAWKLLERRASWDSERDRYVAERLDGQIRYLESKGRLAARSRARFGNLFAISSISALVLGAIASLNSMFWNIQGWVDSILLTFLPTILPAIAAWSLSMTGLFEYKRRAGLCLQMAERLKRKRLELLGARSQVIAANLVSSCEHLLLTELWEWGDTRGERR